MRAVIFKKTDYFGLPEDPVYLDVEGVSFADELPMCYYFDHLVPPMGKITNIAIEDEELWGDVEVFEHSEYHNQLVLDEESGDLITVDPVLGVTSRFRLGGYYNNLTQEVVSEQKRLTSCTLREVSLVPEQYWPSSETEG